MAGEVGSGGPGGPDTFPCCHFSGLQSRIRLEMRVWWMCSP